MMKKFCIALAVFITLSSCAKTEYYKVQFLEDNKTVDGSAQTVILQTDYPGDLQSCSIYWIPEFNSCGGRMGANRYPEITHDGDIVVKTVEGYPQFEEERWFKVVQTSASPCTIVVELLDNNTGGNREINVELSSVYYNVNRRIFASIIQMPMLKDGTGR